MSGPEETAAPADVSGWLGDAPPGWVVYGPDGQVVAAGAQIVLEAETET